MGETSPLATHELVLADRYRDAPRDRELVLDLPADEVSAALLDSDLYERHQRTSERVAVSVQTVAGHLTVDVQPDEDDDERAQLTVASTCTAERGDAVLARVLPVLEAATTGERVLTYEPIL